MCKIVALGLSLKNYSWSIPHRTGVDYYGEKRYSPNFTLLFGLIATVFNFCFSPCSTIRDYLEEGSTSLPFYFTPIWQVKLITITSINDLSFFSEDAKNYPDS